MKYQQLYDTLIDRITSHSYPVESLLPTEQDLCHEFSVSRHTVREAIRRLKGLGLVSQRAGIGTRVELSAPKSRYIQSPDSVAEMLKFSTNTRMHIRAIEIVKAEGKTAEELQCRTGDEWLLLDAVRMLDDSDEPFAWTRTYVNKIYADVRKYIRRGRVATYQLIEQHFQDTVTNIFQDITACVVSANEAKILQAPLRSAALRVVRRYVSPRVDPMLMSFTIHPANRFTFSMQLELNQDLVAKKSVARRR